MVGNTRDKMCLHTALSSQKDKMQAATEIWKETLKVLVLFPLKSHCPICFQKDSLLHWAPMQTSLP